MEIAQLDEFFEITQYQHCRRPMRRLRLKQAGRSVSTRKIELAKEKGG